jgi:hypothetical protein
MAIFFQPGRGSLQLAKTSSNAIAAAKLASIQDLRGHEAGQIMGQGALLHFRRKIVLRGVSTENLLNVVVASIIQLINHPHCIPSSMHCTGLDWTGVEVTLDSNIHTNEGMNECLTA